MARYQLICFLFYFASISKWHYAYSTPIDCYPHLKGLPNATEEKCLAQGCVWSASKSPPCTFSKSAPPSIHECSVVPNATRMACRNPRYFKQPSSQSECAEMGCCYENQTCFQPHVPGYELISWNKSEHGYKGDLILPNGVREGPFGNSIRQLTIEVIFESQILVRTRIFDPLFPRYEVPLPLHKDQQPSNEYIHEHFDVTVTKYPFGLAVSRKSTGEVLFNSTPGIFNGLIFSNQYLELSTSIPSIPKLFGLGEHVGPLLLDADGDHYTLWARDQLANRDNVHTRVGGDNEYGVYPFYIQVEDSGYSHGLYLVNSNAMDVVVQKHSITFRTIGGILDFFIFMGPSPMQVAQQFARLTGLPSIPPYWSLGYHLCRYHYKSINQVKDVVNRMRQAQVPQDTQWTDIDAMDRFLDFTWDNKTFPNMDVFIQDLHAHQQHYIPIVDAGIGVHDPTYLSYLDGMKENIFMKDASGKDLEINRVWPGDVAYPDFFHPRADHYWRTQLERFYRNAAYDGIWLDMNEPSSFCTSDDHKPTSCKISDDFIRSNDVAEPFDPFRQPYSPGQKRNGNLATMTASLAAHHHISLHYNLHSLYGHSELRATRKAIDIIRERRSFVLSRSTYVGDGQYAAHWLGDNSATWEDLRYGLSGVLAMNMLGMPMVGPDICGFSYNTTKELCIRWHQAAILFPFMRNHNSAEKDQAPIDFDDEATDIIRHTLIRRYELLPNLYTLFYEASRDGTPVVRSLYMEFPSNATLALDRQYMLGSALLVSPVLDMGATTVSAYFPPNETWFDLETGHQVESVHPQVVLDVPLSKVPIHLRGGHVIVKQNAELTTSASRRNPMHIVAALSHGNPLNLAEGLVYIDSGDSIDTVANNAYHVFTVKVTSGKKGLLNVVVKQTEGEYNGPESNVPLQSITIFGTEVFSVHDILDGIALVDGKYHSIQVDVNIENRSIQLSGLMATIRQEISIQVRLRSVSKSSVWIEDAIDGLSTM